ncbi:MAG TPA: DUF1566 domain-containing protein [Polyangiaceae bacterium]
MRRRLRIVAAGVSALGFATLARADAPGTQYGYFDSAAQVIQDEFTGLLWERYPPPGTVTLDAAVARCASLSIGGVSGTWRLPTYKELLTLVDEAPHTEYENGGLVSKAIDPNAFPGTLVDAYWWTSSPAASPNVFTVDFSAGASYASSPLGGKTSYARCVQYVGP